MGEWNSQMRSLWVLTDNYSKVSENFASLGATPSLGFLLAGISAGANIAAVVALLARDNELSPPLTGTFLGALPAISTAEFLPPKFQPLWLSREQHKAAPILNEPLLDFIFGKYT